MALACNLVWALISVVLLVCTHAGVKRGTIRLSYVSAMTFCLVICLVLLPAISMSDDLLEAEQAALPLSGQTWRLAAEPVTVAWNLLVLGVCLAAIGMMGERGRGAQERWDARLLAGRLVRAQRLRPPPAEVR